MRKTKEEAAITRQNLLDAALNVFSREGYAATTLDDVAKEAGVTRGAIYWHFGGKAELYTTLITESEAASQIRMDELVAEGGGVIDIMRRIAVHLLREIDQNERTRAIHELVMFKTGIEPELEQGMERKRQGIAALVSEIEGYMQIGIDSGEIRPDVNARDAALAFLGIQQGVIMMWLLNPSVVSLKQRADSLMDIFFEGIRAT
ncbi:MAG: TetR family transcriptional regulator [Burkholderiales bacterium]|nr:TetR family transcriptional regulator [Anaerolineae bacterium]